MMLQGPQKLAEDPEISLIEFLASIRYMIFAESYFIAANGVFTQQRAILPTREKTSTDPEEPTLGEREIQKRIDPFRPFNKRDYTPIEKTPELTEEAIKEKTYSKRFTKKTRYTPEEILKKESEEAFNEMTPIQIEQWCYRQLAMFEKYGQSMDKVQPPSAQELESQTYSKRLEVKTDLSVEEMLGDKKVAMTPAEIEQWAQWQLIGFEKETEYKRHFRASIMRIKGVLKKVQGQLALRQNEVRATEEGVEDMLQIPKGVAIRAFADINTELKRVLEEDPSDEERLSAKDKIDDLAQTIEEVLIEEIVTQDDDDIDLDAEKTFLKRNLSELSRTANDYYAYLRGKYFGKSQDVALNAEVEDCHRIGELFLIAFDRRSTPKVRREAINKLILMIIFSELQKHSRENDEAMKKITDVLTQSVFLRKPGEKKGKTHKYYLYFEKDEKGRAKNCKIEKNKRDLEPGEFSEELQGRLLAVPSDKEGEKTERFVALANREKNLLQRLSKLLRESKTPGEAENDLNGHRFMVESLGDQEVLMQSILESVQESFYATAETRLEKNNFTSEAGKKLQQWVDFVPAINREARGTEGKPYILRTEPIPISDRKMKELKSEAVITALGQDITQAPLFITEFKNTLDGGEFNGSSAASSSELQVLKFKLHVANPKKPGEYDQYEMQFYLPDGYANMLYFQDLRHKRYGIERIFERLIPILFGEEIYEVNHWEAKVAALEEEARTAS